MLLPSFSHLHPSTRRLLLARALRSVGQGALVVDFTLYLNALHWTGVAIGLLLTASGIFGALLSLLIGAASDRIRRKPFLLVYESVALLASLVALSTASPVPLSIVAILGSFGRGANGAAGPFSPAEQAWLAEHVEPRQRGSVYSLNSALGFFGMAAGASMAILPPLWAPLFPGPGSYRPLFLVVTLASCANLWYLSRAEETHRGTERVDSASLSGREERLVRTAENRVLGKLVFVNAFNGVAVGLTGPLLSYWFARRFGVGPSSIAPVMAATFILTGLSSLLTGRLSLKVGVVQSVVWGRLGGLVLLILLPIVPWFWAAALIYLFRSALNRGTAGARQALTMGLVRDERRGVASSLNAVSFQLPQSIGPTVAGELLSLGFLAVPFYAAAILQGIYLVLYSRIFKKFESRS